MYIHVAIAFDAQVTSGLLTLEDITTTKVLNRQLYSQRNTEANYGT